MTGYKIRGNEDPITGATVMPRRPVHMARRPNPWLILANMGILAIVGALVALALRVAHLLQVVGR